MVSNLKRKTIGQSKEWWFLEHNFVLRFVPFNRIWLYQMGSREGIFACTCCFENIHAPLHEVSLWQAVQALSDLKLHVTSVEWMQKQQPTCWIFGPTKPWNESNDEIYALLLPNSDSQTTGHWPSSILVAISTLVSGRWHTRSRHSGQRSLLGWPDSSCSQVFGRCTCPCTSTSTLFLVFLWWSFAAFCHFAHLAINANRSQ